MNLADGLPASGQARFVVAPGSLGSYDEGMPTVHRSGPYRFFFYAGDRDEPAHIHVERENCEAKFWLDPVRLQRSHGFAPSEIIRIERLVVENQQHFLESWDEFFHG